MKVNRTMAIWLGLHGLIIVDIVLITIAMIFTILEDINFDIMVFDFALCIILLAEWLLNFHRSSPKGVPKAEGQLDIIDYIILPDALLPALVPSAIVFRYMGS